MEQPKPISRNYEKILSNISEGIYQIPRFQRDLVWTKTQTAKLIDSILKGFPIGSFILWRTKDRLRTEKDFGGEIITAPKKGEYIYYVLDGQQRLISLYFALRGKKTDRYDYKDIYVDLDKDIDADEQICIIKKPTNYVTVHDLITKDISDFYDQSAGNIIMKKVETLRKIIQNYEFSTIEIENQPLEKIADIFTRINTGGKTLNLFQIMNAKLYREDKPGANSKKGFDLEEKFNELIKDLGEDHETIAENKTIILQLSSLLITKDATKEAILSLDKNKFINEWENTIQCLKLSIDRIVDYLKIPVSKLLPYYTLIIPIAYFYKINNYKKPTLPQLKQLRKYFFRAAISHRFSSSVPTKLNSDIKIIEKIQKNKDVYFDRELPLDNISKEHFIKLLTEEEFSAKNTFSKAIICILASAEPRSFADNSNIRLDNSWLKESSSKNYHHFFPKKYLEKKGESEHKNALANITLIDAYSNKSINDKDPKKYITEFMKNNPDMKDTLKTHFIDLNDFGVLENNYETFLNKRAARLADEIIARI